MSLLQPFQTLSLQAPSTLATHFDNIGNYSKVTSGMLNIVGGGGGKPEQANYKWVEFAAYNSTSTHSLTLR